QLVVRTAGAIAQRVAALDDESGHDAVERQAVVEVVLREVDEVVDRLRRNLRLDQIDHEVTPRRVYGHGVLLAGVDDVRRRRGSLFHCGRRSTLDDGYA